MRTALLGYTGFVGSNLALAHDFDNHYNTSNIADLSGEHFDLVVSSANRADSHRINNNPAEDLAEIDGLISTIRSAKISKLVLISTVCVYPEGGAPDEDTPLSPAGLTPYGVNRLHQERRLSDSFDTLIVRLPQLYGENLRKGVVYDLMNDYRVEHIRPRAKFQHYGVGRLWADIQKGLELGVPSLNIATPPVSNAELAREVFDRDLSSEPSTPESDFSRMYTRNMRTRYATEFGGDDGFLSSRDDEIAMLRQFVSSHSTSRPQGPQHGGI